MAGRPRRRLYLRELHSSAFDVQQKLRAVYLDLSDARWDALIDYHRAVAPNMPIQETISNLLLQALADDQDREAIRQASVKAFKEIRHFMWTEIARAMKGVAESLDIAPVGGQYFGPPVANVMITKKETDPDGSNSRSA